MIKLKEILILVIFAMLFLNNVRIANALYYDFFNITNYTTGEELGSGGTYNRADMINVSAHWNDNISYAQVEHNGTGVWRNYTICSYPNCIEKWTNYTLNLSNSSEYNAKTIAIKAIYANNTTSESNNTSTLLYFYLDPGIPPNVTGLDSSGIIGTLGTSPIAYLFDENIKILANVVDDVGLSLVKANVTYPNNASFNTTMIEEYWFGQLKWTFTFNNTFPINQTGIYVIRVIAIDIGGQEKVSGIDDGIENITLTAYSNYSLEMIDSKNPYYMRGENVTIKVPHWYVEYVDNVNWTVNVTKINETYNITTQATIFNYTIKNDDSEGNYSLSANASKYCDGRPECNSGNLTWEFNVSSNLTIIISTNSTLNPGNSIDFFIYLYNARGELHNPSVNANMTCMGTTEALYFTSGYAHKHCTIPSTYSTLFTIFVNASDQYNNSGENYTNFTTTQAPLPTGGSPGGGGPAPSLRTEIKNCTDGTLYGKCSTTRPLYCSNETLISKCSVCKCESGYSCQSNEICTLTKAEDFNFTIDLSKVEIEQGKDFELKGHISNTGNTILNLLSFLNISNDCCNVSLPLSFTLNEKEEKEFLISIHVPLFTNIGDYWIKIGVGTKYVNKEKLIDVKVIKSSYSDYLSELGSLLSDIEKEIQEYKKVGIDTKNIDNLIGQSKELLSNANSSISTDQVNVLSNSISDLKNNINYVSTSLTLLRGQKFLSQNSWLIILLILSTILTTYFVPVVFMPLDKIEKEIKKLRNEEKVSISSRIETEKQYFTRKIDENTFNKIMITKQDNILKLRGAISEREKERTVILKKMHPIEMLKWFGRGFKNLPKNIKNLFIRAFKKVKAPRTNLFKKQTQK